MFDIYLSNKRDHLLVVPKGGVIPLGGTSAGWRKKKRTVVTVSDEIRLAVQRDGYYGRRLREIRKQLARTDLPSTTPRKHLRFDIAAESAEEHSGKWRVLSSREQSVRETQPYSKKIAHRGWVEPSLLAQIEYRAKSVPGEVRHPFFEVIRDDL